jgi:hypothetical protein
VGGFLPQAIGHARPLTRGAARALGGGGLTGARGDEAGNAGHLVELGPARKPGIDHHANAVERQRGLGNGRGQHDAAAPLRIAPDCRALARRLDLPVQRQDQRGRQALGEKIGGAFDIAHAGQEAEDVAGLLLPGLDHGIGHGLIGAELRACPQPADFERMGLALALDHAGAGHQRGKTRAIERGRHDHHAQILAQDPLRFERERKAEIGVEMTLVGFVEQHRADPGKLGIGQDRGDENRLGHHHDAGTARPFGVEAGDIADGLARFFAKGLGHTLSRRARRHAAGRQDDDRARAPGLVEQGGRERGGLARAGRRDQHGIGPAGEGREQFGQNGMNGKIGHPPALIARGRAWREWSRNTRACPKACRPRDNPRLALKSINGPVLPSKLLRTGPFHDKPGAWPSHPQRRRPPHPRGCHVSRSQRPLAAPTPNAQPEPAAPHAPLQKRRVVAVMLALALAGALGLTLLVGAPLAEPSLETVMARLPD